MVTEDVFNFRYTLKLIATKPMYFKWTKLAILSEKGQWVFEVVDVGCDNGENIFLFSCL